MNNILSDWHPSSQNIVPWSRELQIPKPTNDLVTIIQGVRRCGKSTLLAMLLDKWHLNPEFCFFLNFEDPRLVDQLNIKILDQMFEHGVKQSAGQPFYLFLDEIQLVEHWQKWLRLKVDNPGLGHFIVSGSNSTMLSGELSSTLTGRHLSFELFPFSYREFMLSRNENDLLSYIKYGGFPRALKEENSLQLLQQYFVDITEKDLRERLKAKSSLNIQRLLKIIFESVGSELSLRKLAAQISLSPDTINLYIEAANSSYLILTCPYFSYSERKQMHRNKKYYAIDTAMRRAIITKSGNDLGKDFENIVFLHLRRKYKNVYYWKGEFEVDFVVETSEGIQPIQVTWDETLERHERGLEEFYREFPNALNPLYINSSNFKFL